MPDTYGFNKTKEAVSKGQPLFNLLIINNNVLIILRIYLIVNKINFLSL